MMNILLINIGGHYLISWIIVISMIVIMILPKALTGFVWVDTSYPKNVSHNSASENYLAYKIAERDGDYAVANIEKQKYWRNN